MLQLLGFDLAERAEETVFAPRCRRWIIFFTKVGGTILTIRDANGDGRTVGPIFSGLSKLFLGGPHTHKTNNNGPVGKDEEENRVLGN